MSSSFREPYLRTHNVPSCPLGTSPSPLFRILHKENVTEGLLDSYIIYQPSVFDPCLDRSGYNRSLMGTSSFPPSPLCLARRNAPLPPKGSTIVYPSS